MTFKRASIDRFCYNQLPPRKSNLVYMQYVYTLWLTYIIIISWLS